MRVVFVCTGNTCRSPLAAALLRAKEPRLEVLSAGLAVAEGSAAAREAQEIARERGLDLATHRAQRLAPELVREGVVLALTRAQRDRVRRDFPEAADRVFALGEYAGEPEHDVADPIGLGAAAYRDAAEEIEALLVRARQRLGWVFGGVVAVAADGGAAGVADAIAQRLRLAAVPQMRIEALGDLAERIEQVDRLVGRGEVQAVLALSGQPLDLCAMAGRSAHLGPALTDSPAGAALARQQTGANLLCLDARNPDPGRVWEIAQTFLEMRGGEL